MLSLEDAAKKTLIDAVCAVTFDHTAWERPETGGAAGS